MAGLSLEHPWAFAFGLLGNVISFMTFLAPIPTFYRIYKSKSTEGFQSVPYVVALFSAMLWIFYALIKSNETFLITINAAGCVIETIYIVMYFVYAPKKAKLFTAKIMALLNGGVFGVILLLTLLLFKGSKRVVLLGWICVGFSVSVFVAPLSIMRRVIQTKSVEYMPFSLSLSLTLSAVVWFLYGLLIKDKYVALPNVLGFIFGVVQMVLYVFYMNKTPVAAAVGKDAGKLPSAADDHVLVNIAKLNPALPERTSGTMMHPVTQMAAVPARSCAAEATAPAMLPNRDVVDVFVSRHSPAVHVV
ncbi:Bidirectional sugar transporter SWEET13 [Zea mays]|uniref:Bidirectional sugar transporter SWEET n=1 Tax=Zea mays TaxID=4577 RepID=A0A3L6GDW7_MAIZE|nr:Bidirectional sugar transporter SWEET13 [Zea mays]